MTTNGIIGREYEMQLINTACNSEKAELVAVYGRRRVGKTYLVRQMFNNDFAFSFTGMYDTSRTVQLERHYIRCETQRLQWHYAKQRDA